MNKPKKILFPIRLSKGNVQYRDLLTDHFSKYLELSSSSVLEIGIGNGRFGFLLGDKVSNYSGIDLNPEYVKIAKTNIPEGAEIDYKFGDAEKIPFDKQFDIVLYAFSWNKIKDLDKAALEAKRVLKPNGIVAILEPLEEEKNWANPRLKKDSPEFDEEYYKQRTGEIRKGRKAIEQQKLFKIVEEYKTGVGPNLWILKIS